MESLRSRRFPIRPRGTSADKETEHKRTSSLPAQTSSSTTPSNRVGRFSPSVPTSNHYSELVNKYFPKGSQSGLPINGFASSRYLPRRQPLSSESRRPRRRSVDQVASEGLIRDLKNLQDEEASGTSVNFKAAQNDAEYAEFSAQALKNEFPFNYLEDNNDAEYSDYHAQLLKDGVWLDYLEDQKDIEYDEYRAQALRDGVRLDYDEDSETGWLRINNSKPSSLTYKKSDISARSKSGIQELWNENDRSRAPTRDRSNLNNIVSQYLFEDKPLIEVEPQYLAALRAAQTPIRTPQAEDDEIDSVVSRWLKEQDPMQLMNLPRTVDDLHSDLAFADDKARKLKEKAQRNHSKEFSLASARFPASDDSHSFTSAPTSLVMLGPNSDASTIPDKPVVVDYQQIQKPSLHDSRKQAAKYAQFMEIHNRMKELRLDEEDKYNQLSELRQREERIYSHTQELMQEADIKFRVLAGRLESLQPGVNEILSWEQASPEEQRKLVEFNELYNELESKRKEVETHRDRESALKKRVERLRYDEGVSWQQIRKMRLEEEVNLQKAELLDLGADREAAEVRLRNEYSGQQPKSAQTEEKFGVGDNSFKLDFNNLDSKYGKPEQNSHGEAPVEPLEAILPVGSESHSIVKERHKGKQKQDPNLDDGVLRDGACLGCLERNSKCDENKPLCGSCSSHMTVCIYGQSAEDPTKVEPGKHSMTEDELAEEAAKTWEERQFEARKEEENKVIEETRLAILDWRSKNSDKNKADSQRLEETRDNEAAIQWDGNTNNDIPTPKVSNQEAERQRTTREILQDKPIHALTQEDVNKISENRKIEWRKQLDKKLMRDIFMKEIAQRDDLTDIERTEIYSKASFQESKTAFYEIMNRKIKEAAERSSPPTVTAVPPDDEDDKDDEASDGTSDSEAVGRNGELDLAEVMRQSSKRFVQDDFKETPQTTLKKEEKKYRNMTITELNEIMVTGTIVESKLALIELFNRTRAAERRATDTKKKEAAAEREAEDPSTPWVFPSPPPPPTTIPPDHLPPYFKPREYVLYDPKESASTPALLSTETEGTSSSLISTHHETVIAQDTSARHETEPYYGYRENASAPALASDTDSLARYAMQEHMDVSDFKKVENLLASATTSCRPSYNAESEATASVVLPTESESEGVGSTSIAAVGIENEVVVTAVSTGVVAHENEVMPPQLAEETNNTAEESASPPPPPPPAEEVKEQEEEDYEPMDDSLAKFYKDRAVLSLADGHLQEADEIITRLERRANVPAGVDGWGASIYRKTIQVLISSNKLDMAEKLIDHFMVLYSSSSSNSTAGLVKKTPLVSRVGSSKSSFSTKSREAIIPWTTSEAYVKYYKKVSRLKLLNALASKPRDLAMAEKHVNKLLSLLEKMNTGGGWKSSDLVERTHLLAVRGCLKYLKDLPQPAVEELAIVTADGKGLVADRLKVKTWDYLARAYFEASQINSAAKFCQRAVTAYRNADPNSKSSMEALKLMIKIKEAKGDNLEADGYRSMLRPDENTDEFLVDEARNLNNNARTNAPATAKTKAVLQKLVLGPEWTKTKQVLATYRFPTSLLENYHKLDDLSQMMIVAKRFKGGIQTSLQLLDSAQGVVADSIRLNMNDLLRAMLEISKYNSALSSSGYGHPLINFTFMDTWRPPGSKRSFVGRFRPKTLKVTPLSLATDKDNLAAIRILIAHGANVNLKSSHGNTALHLAVKHGRVDVIKILLEAGADVSMMNERGKNALDVARHAEVLRLLKPRMYLLGKQDMGTKSVFDFVADCL